MSTTKIENAEIAAVEIAADVPAANVPMLREIGAGETFNTATVIDAENNLVTCRYSFRPHSGGKRYEKNTVFDFTGVSHEQMLGLAVSSIRIDAQAMLRNSEPADMLNPDTMANVNVLRDMLSVQRTSANPVSNVLKNVAKMSPSQFAQLQRDMLAMGIVIGTAPADEPAENVDDAETAENVVDETAPKRRRK
jgi:hypothetical protein